VGTRNCRHSTPDCLVCAACGAEVCTCSSRDCDSRIETLAEPDTPNGGIADASDDVCSSGVARALVAGLEGLDLLGIGWLICTDSCLVLTASRVAWEVLHEDDGLVVGPKCMICCASQESTQLLHEAVQRVGRVPSSERPESGVTVQVRRRSGKRPLIVSVRSLRTRLRRDARRRVVLLLIVDPAVPISTSLGDLHDLYRFTAAETELANLLMSGRSLMDCSRELGVSHSTVRSHLGRMFRKTRVRHQSQLVGLLLRSIGLIRRGRG
jgi:DNA-binding CsgD family transcriptional regulator